MILRTLAPIVALFAIASCTSGPRPASPAAVSASAAPPLKLASWNLEFLAERDGAGCAPKTRADYEAMRQIADTLNADVIAFQEAENVAAASRVFDPARYTIVMEARAGQASGTCGGKHPQQSFIRQAVGFAVRRGVEFDRHADVTTLMLGNPQLRSGVDITLRARGHAPIRLLGVHLKSGCFSGDRGQACPTLLQQIPAVEQWIDDAARGPTRFAVLGDWNRRLGEAGDRFWTEIDDGDPANADLRLADDGTQPKCDPRYSSFIDHIVLDRRAGAGMLSFAETTYASGAKHYSDHCPISVTVRK